VRKYGTNFLMNLLHQLGIIGILAVGCWLVLQGNTEVGTIVAFIHRPEIPHDHCGARQAAGRARLIPDALAQPEKPQDKDDNNDQADDVDDAVHEITFAWIKVSNRMLQAIHYTPICTVAFPARTLRTPGRIKSDSLLDTARHIELESTRREAGPLEDAAPDFPLLADERGDLLARASADPTSMRSR